MDKKPKEKNLLLIAFVLIALIIVMVIGGICVVNNIKNNKNNLGTEITEIVSEIAAVTETESESMVAVDKVNFDRHIENDIESATITAVDYNGNTIWQYDTQKYECAMLDRVSEIGINEDHYYLAEDGAIIAFDLQSGKLLWKNNEFGGSCSSYAFDESGNLFMCGFETPDFFAVDKTGKTLSIIQSFSDVFGCAYEVTYLGDKVSVKLEMGYDSGEPVVYYVDTKDYTYSLFEDNAKKIGRWDNLQATCVAEQYAVKIEDNNIIDIYAARENYHGTYQNDEGNAYKILLTSEESYDNSDASWSSSDINLDASVEISEDGSICTLYFDGYTYTLTKTE